MSSYKRNFPKPVMAVLVTSNIISGLQRQNANSRTRMLAAANKEVENTLFFFSLSGVRLRDKKISGYYWHNRQRKWLQHDFSLPDILYLRGKVDKRYSQTFARLCKMITKGRGELITHTRFNKWQIYQILYNDPKLKHYLPGTITVRQSHDIEKMLRRYKVVYLKSHFGKKGEHVLRVEALPNGSYRYSYYRYDSLTARFLSSFKDLLNTIHKFFQGKRFLIQQGIQLPEFKNKLIDMRAEVQRNGGGSLEVVGISVRYGRPGSPITTHGGVFKFEDFFVKHMGYSSKELEAFRDVCENFLFDVYGCIERYCGRYAEIGIDFAIDANSKIWFIEANSQSTKASLKKAYGKEAISRYYKNILEYARYLYKQSGRG